MDYHVRISANIVIKKVNSENETNNLSSSSASAVESMIIESLKSSEIDTTTSNSTSSNLMDLDDESFNPSSESSSSESMITDEDTSSNDSFESAVENFQPVSHSSNTSSSIKKSRVSISKRAGLIFPVKRLYNRIKGKYLGKRVSIKSCIELAGVLEYAVAELLDLSGNKTHELDHSTIVPRHIFLAIHDDNEFKSIFSKVTLPQCGTIESFLTKK